MYKRQLELSGKPTKVLSGDKIGKVTITIENTEMVLVSSADELAAALAQGGHIKLAAGAEITSISVPADTTVLIDLNEVSGVTLTIADGANVTITTTNANKYWRAIDSVTIGSASLTTTGLTYIENSLVLNSTEARIDLGSVISPPGLEVTAMVSGCNTSQFTLESGVNFHDCVNGNSMPPDTVISGELTPNKNYYVGYDFVPIV